MAPVRVLPALVLAALTACADGAPALVPTPEEEGYGVREGFDPRARTRRVDSAFSTHPSLVRAGADGSLWVLYSGYATLEASLQGTPLLQRLVHVSAEGRLLHELPADGVSGFASHPGGELTLLVGRTGLRRVRPDGQLVAERSAEVVVPPEDRQSYLVYPDASYERVQEEEAPGSQRVLALEARGEDVLVLLRASGARVLALDEALRPRWASRALFPSVSLRADAAERQALGYPLDGEQLAVDEAGRPAVAALFPPSARPVYRDASGQEPEGAEGNAVLVVGLEAGGAQRFARALPREGTSLSLAGLAVRGERVAVATYLHRPLDPPLPNDSVELDLVLSMGRLDRPAAEAHTRVLSLDRDDSPTAFFPCGVETFCLAGSTGTVSVDTKSMVQEGRGFLLVLDGEGAQRDLALFGGPRHTFLASAAAGPDSTVVFAASANGPITHTGDVDRSLRFNELWAGVLKLP